MKGSTIQGVPLRLLRLDGDTQPRVDLPRAAIDRYVAAIRRGDVLPEAVAYLDPEGRYWLADGFLRYHALAEAGRDRMLCEVRRGTLDGARLYAASANHAHGEARLPEDERRAVWLAISCRQAELWPDARVAAHCRVDESLVAEVRDEVRISGNPEDAPAPRSPGRTFRPGDVLSDEDRLAVYERALRLRAKLERWAAVLGTDLAGLLAELSKAELFAGAAA
jgi:hypothetical protein